MKNIIYLLADLSANLDIENIEKTEKELIRLSKEIDSLKKSGKVKTADLTKDVDSKLYISLKSALESQIKSMKQNLEESRLIAIDSKFSDFNKKYDEAQSRIAAFESENIELKKALDESTKAVSASTDALSKSNESLEKHKDALLKSTNSLKVSTGLCEQYKKEADALKEEKSTLEASLKTSTEALTKANKLIESINVEKLHTVIESVEANLLTKEAIVELVNNNEQLSATKEIVIKLHTAATAVSEMIEQQGADAESLGTVLDDVFTARDKLQAYFDLLNVTIKDLDSKIVVFNHTADNIALRVSEAAASSFASEVSGLKTKLDNTADDLLSTVAQQAKTIIKASVNSLNEQEVELDNVRKNLVEQYKTIATTIDHLADFNSNNQFNDVINLTTNFLNDLKHASENIDAVMSRTVSHFETPVSDKPTKSQDKTEDSKDSKNANPTKNRITNKKGSRTTPAE